MDAYLKPTLAALLSALIILGATGFMARADRMRFKEHQRQVVMKEAGILRARLEGALHSRVYLAHTVSAYIKLSPKLTQADFTALGQEIIGSLSGIRNLTLARHGVISHLAPLNGNTPALGLDLLHHPTQGAMASLVASTRQTWIAGPLDLVQGGRGLVCRSPVVLPDGSLWGITSVVIDEPTLYAEAGLTRENAGLELALRGRDSRGAQGEVFWGDPALFTRDTLLLEIQLPSGAWQLAALPKGGWGTSPHQGPLWLAGLLLAMIVSPMLWRNLRLTQLLRAEIGERERVEAEERSLIVSLRESLATVKTLNRLLPICASCKKIRNDEGYWQQVETYISHQTDAVFTHSICPECAHRLYGDFLPDEDA